MKQTLEFASSPANLSRMRQFVRDFLATTPLPEDEADLVVLGLDEACANIIRYAYKNAEIHPIALCCETDGDALSFRLRDYGEQADPEHLQPLPVELVRPGGLGIHLIRRAFDTVDYKLQSQGTELVLVKRLAR